MITRALPAWFVVIGVILVLQTVSATLGRLVPVAGPAFTAEFGWNESWVGYLTAANIVGALFALTAGIGVMRRMGGVRALQWSLLIGAAALLLYLIPSIALALFASACVGLGQRHRQSGGQRGADAADAAGAPQPGVFDQAGRRAARRRARRSRHSAADRSDGLAVRRGRRRRRLHRRDLADLAVPVPHRSAARAEDAAPPGQFPPDRHPGAAALARARQSPLAGVLGRRAAGGPAGRLGDVRGDLSRRRARPVAQHGRSRVRGDADDQHARPRHARDGSPTTSHPAP